MSTIDATMSLLKTMSYDDQREVYEFVLFKKNRELTSSMPKVSKQKVLDDLAVSRKQIENGEGIPADEALNKLGEKYGFV